MCRPFRASFPAKKQSSSSSPSRAEIFRSSVGFRARSAFGAISAPTSKSQYKTPRPSTPSIRPPVNFKRPGRVTSPSKISIAWSTLRPAPPQIAQHKEPNESPYRYNLRHSAPADLPAECARRPVHFRFHGSRRRRLPATQSFQSRALRPAQPPLEHFPAVATSTDGAYRGRLRNSCTAHRNRRRHLRFVRRLVRRQQRPPPPQTH